MQLLGVRKFFLDYLFGSALILLFLYLLFGNITVMDTRATVSLQQSCSANNPAPAVMQHLHGVLRDGEYCEVVSPCDEWLVVQCKGVLQTSDLYGSLFGGGSLVYRIVNTLSEPYGVIGFKDSSTFRFTSNTVIFLLFYLLLLVEAGAMLFALWRQKKLKQTFRLPEGSKRDQLLKPALYAVLFAIAMMLLNYLVLNVIGHPPREDHRLVSTLLSSVFGIVIVVGLAPLVEELIFRGVLLRFFIEKRRVLLGTLVVSLLFSVMHGFVEEDLSWQLYLSSIYFIGSVVLCRVYFKQKNLWSPIVFHSAYNSTLVVAFHVFSTM